MNLKETIKTLEQYQAWRRDDDFPSQKVMPNPKDIGIAIDFAINFLKKKNKST